MVTFIAWSILAVVIVVVTLTAVVIFIKEIFFSPTRYQPPSRFEVLSPENKPKA